MVSASASDRSSRMDRWVYREKKYIPLSHPLTIPQTVEMWHEDGGTSSELAYKNVPFYLSSNGYGIFIPSSAFISYEIQSERTTRVNIAIPGEALSMYLIYGPSPKEILNKYTLLTGRPALVPAWTFGLWLSTSFTTNYDEKTVDGFLDGMKERNIPTAVFHYDCFWMRGFHWCDFEFDPDYFPDPKAQLASLKKRGIKVRILEPLVKWCFS